MSMNRRNFLELLGTAAIVAPVAMPGIVEASPEQVAAITKKPPPDFEKARIGKANLYVAYRDDKGSITHMQGWATALDITMSQESLSGAEGIFVGGRRTVEANMKMLVDERITQVLHY